MAMSATFKRRLQVFLVIDAALLLLVVFLLMLRSERNDINELRELGITEYPDPFILEPFQLERADGSEFTLDSVGKTKASDGINDTWSLFFFGFTNCPSVCPLTMQQLGRFFAAPGDEELKRQLDVIMVSVDPANDTATDVQAYVNRYNDDFIGLAGTPDQLKGITRQFFVAYTEPVALDDTITLIEHEGGSDDHSEHMQEQMAMLGEDVDYIIEHNGHIAVVDPQRRLRAVIRPPLQAEALAEGLRRVIFN
jgi:protein SCO1/2